MTSMDTPKKKSQLVVEELTRREELIKTAVELFSAHGFNGTSIRDIARSQGISTANMYHHFKNKEDLFFASMEYLTRMLPERLEEVWQEDADPLERFKQLLKVHLMVCRSYQKEAKMFMLDQDLVSRKHTVKLQQIKNKVLNIYFRHVESLHQAGYVATKQTKIMAYNILAVINWYLRWYKSDGSLPGEAITDELVAFILYGAVGRPGPGPSRRKPT